MFLSLMVSKKTGREAMLTIADQLLASVTSFLSGVMVANANDKTDYADYFLGLSILYLFVVVQRSLVTVPLQVLSRSCSEKEKPIYYLNSYILNLLLSLSMFAIIVPLGIFAGGDGVWSMVTVICFASLFTSLREFVRAVLLADLKASAATLLNVTSSGIILGGYAALYFYYHLSPARAFIVMGIGGLLPTLLAVAVHAIRGKTAPVSLKNIPAHICNSWNYGRWIFASVAANSVSARAIPWVLLLSADKNSVAEFAALSTVAGLLNPFINGFISYLNPKFANMANSGGPIYTIKKSLALFHAAVLCALVYAAIMYLLGDELTGLFYPSDYVGYSLVLLILSLEVGVKGANLSLSAALRAVHSPNIEFRSNATGSAVTFLMGWFVIPDYGLFGAAISLLSGYTVVAALNYIYLANYR